MPRPVPLLQLSNVAIHFPINESIESLREGETEAIRNGAREACDAWFAVEPSQPPTALVERDSDPLESEFECLNVVLSIDILNLR